MPIFACTIPFDVIHPDNIIGLVIGEVYIQTGDMRVLMDGIHLGVISGDASPLELEYHESALSFQSYTSSVSAVAGQHCLKVSQGYSPYCSLSTS